MKIGYTMIGVNDIARSAQFYDVVLGTIGAKRIMENEKFVLWSDNSGQPSFSICIPFNGNEATIGNGSMIAFALDNNEMVHKIYDCAIKTGASCEGRPGIRNGDYYICYFRDFDGNKLAAYHYPHDDHL